MTDAIIKSGKLINVEGPGGCGKSTIGQILGDCLQYKLGLPTKVFTNWFQATKYGKHCWEFLQTKEGLELNNLTYALMVLSVRRQFIEEFAYPLTQSGTNVIVESFYDSLIVSMAKRGPLNDFMNLISRSESLEGLNIRPDITVYINTHMFGGERFNEFNNDSYPDPWETIGLGYGLDALGAWKDHIEEVMRDLANEPNTKIISLDAFIEPEGHRAILTNIAELIAIDQLHKL